MALAAAAGANAASAPSVNGVYATSVALTSAQLIGYIDPRGSATTYYFQYGPTSAYGAQTPPGSAGAGTSEVQAAAPLGGLAAGTTYHFRLVATNATGTTAGADHFFTTTRVPLSFQLVALPSPIAFGDSLTIQGTLTGTGSAGRELELQIDPFPYVTGMVRWGSPVVSDAAGHFAFPPLSLAESVSLRVATVGAPIVRSSVIPEKVALRVRLHARRLHLRGRRGRFYRMYGTVTPADPGRWVAFQLVRGGFLESVGGVRVKRGGASYSRFSSIVRLRHAGVYQAFVASGGRYVSADSEPLRIH